jgi:hypothetical protein
MRIFAVDGLHIFIMVVLAAFVILSILALLGKFDHWSTRFIRRYIFRRNNDVYYNRRTGEKITNEHLPDDDADIS